jgi:hypothetical protein
VDEWLEYTNHMSVRFENYVDSPWDGIIERPGSREERKREKKTRR